MSLTAAYILLARASHTPKFDICWVGERHLPQTEGCPRHYHKCLTGSTSENHPKILSGGKTKTFYSGKFFFKFQSENIELNAQLMRTVFHLHFVELLGSHLIRRIRNDGGKERCLRGRPGPGPTVRTGSVLRASGNADRGRQLLQWVPAPWASGSRRSSRGFTGDR